LEVAPLAGARIETPYCGASRRASASRPSRRGADRNSARNGHQPQPVCRPSRRGADRNCIALTRTPRRLVAPLAGARIETAINRLGPQSGRVAPLAGARIETYEPQTDKTGWGCRPSRRGADRNRRRRQQGICRLLSPLSQGRGSKPALRHVCDAAA